MDTDKANGGGDIIAESAPPLDTPVTQNRYQDRKLWPMWAKQFPRRKLQPQDETFQLIKHDDLVAALQEKGATQAAIDKILADMNFLDHELLRLFRDRDYNASHEQNRYRAYQMTFMALATLATLVGTLQAWALNADSSWLPWIAFFETFVALATTYVATISSRESPLPAWLMNRRRAEYLRREYFRFLMDLDPYNAVTGTDRKQLLSLRAANISRGIYPDKSAE